MIDCLSNPSWINPQIDFLLYWQNIRIQCPQIIDKFFLSITILGEFWLPTLICAIVYWCIDFKTGIYLFTLEGVNCLVTNFFKMLACVNRPWILDNRIKPSELAVPFARGYSFPSGHSAMSSSVVGGVAYYIRKNKSLCVSLIAIILLVGFSRLWLGVHTPQDVVCGLLTGLILVFALNKIINYAQEDKKRYIYLALIINIITIAALIYIYYFNTYRIEYTSGELLVDPVKMKYITTSTYGFSLGIINGCFLCRLLCPFEPKNTSIKRRIIRGIIGAIGIILLLKFLVAYTAINMIDFKAIFLIEFLTGISITLVYPFIFSKLKF